VHVDESFFPSASPQRIRETNHFAAKGHDYGVRGLCISHLLGRVPALPEDAFQPGRILSLLSQNRYRRNALFGYRSRQSFEDLIEFFALLLQ
jgi:hypothetical protein